MILACPACDGRYDVTGHPVGQQFRCRCGTVITLEAPSPQAGVLACPHCGAGVAPTSNVCGYCSHQLLLKACPRCLSRVFHGHKHCPDCGAELSVVATAETSADRACPRCDQPLGARRVEDIVIDECMGCRGLFLDHIAIQRLVTDRQQARAESLLGVLPTTITFDRQPPGKLYVKCPVCKVIMNRKLFAAGSGVIIDVCRAHGTFFDIGELPRIIEYVMQGGLERAARKEIDAARAAAQREQYSASLSRMEVTRPSEPGGATAGAALVDLLFTLFR